MATAHPLETAGPPRLNLFATADRIGWVAMQGKRVAGELRATEVAAQADAKKLGSGAWVAPVYR